MSHDMTSDMLPAIYCTGDRAPPVLGLVSKVEGNSGAPSMSSCPQATRDRSEMNLTPINSILVIFSCCQWSVLRQAACGGSLPGTSMLWLPTAESKYEAASLCRARLLG